MLSTVFTLWKFSINAVLLVMLSIGSIDQCTSSALSTDCQGRNLGIPGFCSNPEAAADLCTMKSSLPAFLGSEGDEISIMEQPGAVPNNEGLQRKSKIKTSILMA